MLYLIPPGSSTPQAKGGGVWCWQDFLSNQSFQFFKSFLAVFSPIPSGAFPSKFSERCSDSGKMLDEHSDIDTNS
jgi:hypothetical protein